MSIPKQDQVYGSLLYRGTYMDVVNIPLPKYLLDGYDRLKRSGHHSTMEVFSLFPQCKWEIKRDRLYLTELFQPNLLKALCGEDIIHARWVQELITLHATVYEYPNFDIRAKLYLRKFRFEEGVLVDKKLVITRNYGMAARRFIYHLGLQEGIFIFNRDVFHILDNQFMFYYGYNPRDFDFYLGKEINTMLNLGCLKKDKMTKHMFPYRKYVYYADETTYEELEQCVNRIMQKFRYVALRGILGGCLLVRGNKCLLTSKKYQRIINAICNWISGSRCQIIEDEVFGDTHVTIQIFGGIKV